MSLLLYAKVGEQFPFREAGLLKALQWPHALLWTVSAGSCDEEHSGRGWMSCGTRGFSAFRPGYVLTCRAFLFHFIAAYSSVVSVRGQGGQRGKRLLVYVTPQGHGNVQEHLSKSPRGETPLNQWPGEL